MMRRLRELVLQIKALFRSGKLSDGIDAEIEQHLEFMVADLVAEGMSPEEARAAALRKFGNVTRVEEDTRDSWGNRALLDTARNFRFGLRLCARYPASSILAVIVLALGVAISTVMFTLSTRLLNDTAGAELDQRDVAIAWPAGSNRRAAINARDFAHFRDARSLELLVGIQNSSFWFHQPSQPESGAQYRGVVVTPNFFELANAGPMRGRIFTPQDALSAAERVIVISDAAWANIYDRDEAALGAIATVDGQNHRIIGIMPPGFAFPGEQQLWIPAQWGDAGTANASDAPEFSVAGRLKPGVTREQARAELDTIAAQLASAFPDTNQDRTRVLVTPYREQFVDDDAVAILIMGLAGSILVLSLASTNAFQLILVRTARRTHELAVRCSLGARRSHVITQVVVDGLVLSGIGTAIGLGLAAAGLRFITASLAVFGMPGLHTFHLQPGAVLFAVGAGLFAGVASSIVPAWRASRMDSFTILKDDSKQATSIYAGKLARMMMVEQVAFSCVLIFFSLMLLSPAIFLDSLSIPYDERSVLTAQLQLGTDPQLDSPEKVATFHQRLQQQLTTVPGVQAVAWSTGNFGLLGRFQSFVIEGDEGTKTRHQSMVSSVTPEYLDVFGMKPVSGRMIIAADTRETPPVCVVDSRFVAAYFPRESPIGKRLNLARRQGQSDWATIVGVAPSVKPDLPVGIEQSVGKMLHEIMRPYAQAPSGNLTLLLSAPNASAYQYRRAVRESLRDLAPRVRIRGSILTLDERLEFVRRFGRSISTAGIWFGGAIFLTSIIGLYATISFATAQRRREFGIRLAVGASGWEIAKTVLKPWAKIVAAGLFLGALCTLGLIVLQATLMDSEGAGPKTDLAEFAQTFLLVALTVCIAGLIAAGLPAWRATKINPIDVIRTD